MATKMLNQRKHKPSCSPPNSYDEKRLRNNFHEGATPKSFSEANLISRNGSDESPRPLRLATAARKSSDLLEMKTVQDGSARGAELDLSNGRCAPPSTMFSIPISTLSSELSYNSKVSTDADLSFATANQSFCIIPNDVKVTAEETNNRDKTEIRTAVKNPIAGRDRKGLGREKYRRKEKKLVPNESQVFFMTTNFEGEESLATVGEDEDADRKRQRILQHRPVSPLFSSDDDFCSGGSNFGSEMSGSEAESAIEDRRRETAGVKSRPLSISPAETRMNEADDKIISWKEARTIKLMTKQKKEEACIDAWEKKKATKAKMEMINLEAKLEKRREIGMEKMLRKLKVASMEAERKKLKEREAISLQMAKLEASFQKMTLARSRTPWRLLFL